MAGESLQVEDLCALRGEARQQRGLAGAGRPIDQHQARMGQVGVVEPSHHLAAPGPVAAGQEPGAPADIGQDGGHGPRTLPAAPAVDQGPEGAVLVGQGGVQVARDIARDQRGPQAPRLEPALLDVDRPDDSAFLVGEHRQVEGARHVILGELGGAAHVDHRIEAGQGGGVDVRDGLYLGHGRCPAGGVGARVSIIL